MNKLAVIIVTRDHAEFLDECLNSVELEFNTGTKIFVVDVGSTDGTADIILNYQTKSKNSVDIIQISRNSTPLDAFRSLIGRVETHFVSVISGDDYFLPGYGSLSLNLVERVDLKSVINFAHLIVNEKSEIIGKRVPKWNSIAALDRKLLLYSNPGTTAGCILPWKILVDNCLSNTDFNSMIEDYYYQIKLVNQVRFIGVQTPVVGYRKHSSNLSNSVNNTQYIKSLGVSVRLSWNMARGFLEKLSSVFLLFRWARHVPVKQLSTYLRGFLAQTIS